MSKSENKKSAPPKTPVTSKAKNATGQIEPTPRPKWWLNNKRYIQIVPGLDTVEIWSEGEPNWIAQVYTEEHAELICRAVNSFDEACRITKMIEMWMDAGSDAIHFDTLMPDGDDENETFGNAITAFLAKVKKAQLLHDNT